jgi:TonB-linked SusC/RagA family outer membrane protein
MANAQDVLSNRQNTEVQVFDSVAQREKIVQVKNYASDIIRESIDGKDVEHLSFLSLQQMLKGKASGLYVQESTGEPGTIQSMTVRGLSSPIFSGRDVAGVQPAVYLNGIPLIQGHLFGYDVQQYEVNPIGPATNILSTFDAANIVSVKVVKDPLELAKLGPLAVNGAILITTNSGYTRGPNVSVSMQAGIAAPPLRVTPTNASYEKEFRQRFFSAHNINNFERYMPDYIRDTENENYFGKANWADTYYRFEPQYNVSASIAGGGSVADYMFAAGFNTTPGIADGTNVGKYNISYFINMKPFDGFILRCMLDGSHLLRERNKNFRDRFAETEYLPDLTLPVMPSGDAYRSYYNNYNDNAIDDNTSNLLKGYLDLSYTIGKLLLGVNMRMDYNSHIRHFFLPSYLLEGISFVSEYSGYNRRIVGEGTVNYNLIQTKNHHFDFRWQGSIMADRHGYNYIKGYDGESDEYKTSKNGNYTSYRYKDYELANMVSTSATVNYKYKELIYLDLIARYDGYSNLPVNNRWLFSPAVSARWNLKNQFLGNSKIVSNLKLGISASRSGRLAESDRFALGTQYTSEDLNWSGQSVISSYAGYPSLTRSYRKGWIDYDVEWAYSEKFSVDMDAAFINDRINFNISLYSTADKNQMLRVNVPQEFGYQYQYLGGMDVENTGIDLVIGTNVFKNPKGFSWNTSFNLNYNRNQLTHLPGGVDELVVGNYKLKVGEAIDRFWVLENRGIYVNNSDVPSKNGIPLSVGATTFGSGDPVWIDQNNDNIINNDDKILKANARPTFTGGFTNTFRYGALDLQLHAFFSLGHSALNYRDQQRYDFMTVNKNNSLENVKEIYFWQNTHQNDDYPLYNPLSEVHPYRADQDLFLESLSYFKLRSATLGYTFSKLKNLYLYLTATNLFTLTKFRGEDPELVEFNGNYTGYSQPLPKTLLVGVKFKF